MLACSYHPGDFLVKAPTSYLVGEWGNRDGYTELT
jgi:hypothetical protein